MGNWKGGKIANVKPMIMNLCDKKSIVCAFVCIILASLGVVLPFRQSSRASWVARCEFISKARLISWKKRDSTDIYCQHGLFLIITIVTIYPPPDLHLISPDLLRCPSCLSKTFFFIFFFFFFLSHLISSAPVVSVKLFFFIFFFFLFFYLTWSPPPQLSQ